MCRTKDRARPDCRRQIGIPHSLEWGLGGAAVGLSFTTAARRGRVARTQRSRSPLNGRAEKAAFEGAATSLAVQIKTDAPFAFIRSRLKEGQQFLIHIHQRRIMLKQRLIDFARRFRIA